MESLGASSKCEDVIAALPEGAAALKGATVIVTGSNTGIGQEAAKQLASVGARVVLACRSVGKAEEARQEILKVHPEATVSVIALDLGDLTSVKSFADNFVRESDAGAWGPLKLLVLNAGLVVQREMRSKQGHEMTFAVNHLGHFYLTKLLLPQLRAAAPARVVVVSSGSHYGPLRTKQVEDALVMESTFADPPGREGASLSLSHAMELYGSSKLCNVLFANKLQELEGGSGVTVCSLHPGNLIPTDISRNTNAVARFLARYVISWFTKSVNQGTSTTVFCSLAPAEAVAGKYFDGCKEKPCSRRATSKAADVLWQLSEDLVARL